MATPDQSFSLPASDWPDFDWDKFFTDYPALSTSDPFDPKVALSSDCLHIFVATPVLDQATVDTYKA